MADPGPSARLVSSYPLVAEVAAVYSLAGPVRWRDLGGSRSTNLLLDVDNGHRLVARVHSRSTTADRLAAEQDVRVALARAGVPVAVPIADKTGRTVRTLASGRLVEIEGFIPSTGRMKTPGLLQVGFGLLGRVHDLLRTMPVPAAARTVAHANHIASVDALQSTQRGAERIRRWHDRRLTHFATSVVAHVAAVAAAEECYQVEQVRQVVHGEFWDNNVLFDHGTVVALLDFGFMSERSRIDDLALPIWFYLLERGRGIPGDDDRLLVRDLIDAYDAGTTRPLSAAERLSLPLAIARQPAWSVGRWILQLDHAHAVRHARAADTELPIAQEIMRHIDRWQRALT